MVATPELTGEQASDVRSSANAGGRRRPPVTSVLALQRLAGNRAAAQLLRAPADQVPEGVDAGVALPAGATTPDAGQATLADGKVGGVDRVLLDGLPGSQGKDWDSGAADKGHFAVTGKGPRGHRGRAIALVPQGMKGDGPVSVVVHLHGMDVGVYKGSSGMRETGDRPEDVKYFQIPQQLEAFTKKHPGARLVVLMPLGVTAGGMSKFGIDDFDAYLDAALGQLGLSGRDGTLYLSAHSGGGFTISALASDPSWHPARYRFGGVFAFESFHSFDMKAWQKLIRGHLKNDLGHLKERRRSARRQLEYLRDEGFHFVAFGGFGGYAGRVTTLRRTILDWFAENRLVLRDVVDDSRVLDTLWRNYQAVEEDAGHMQALSKSSHLESALESLTDGAAAAAPAPATSPAPARHDDPRPVPEDEHATPKAQAEHKHESKTPSHKPHGSGSARDVGADGAFRREHYRMSSKQKVLVGKDGHKRGVSKSPLVYTAEVLKKAFPNREPADWYDNFTSGLRFLGRPIRDPIHITLADHLHKIERELVRDYGGPDQDPAVAGRAVGLDDDEAIIGARDYPTSAPISMHLFGLALDINYTQNPFIGASANDVFKRAGQLVHGKAASWTVNMSYAQLAELNATLIEYFKLANDLGTLKDKLRDATGPWAGMKTEDAQPVIEADLSAKPVSAKEAKRRGIKPSPGGLAWRWARGDKIEVVRQTGFMNVTEKLVRGLKLNWGAAYGDVMHFDLRDQGDGAKIYGAIGPYLTDLKHEADAADPDAAR